ncbi:hypothetical protein [Sphingomonas kyungheensis]|uniref:DUF1254 domain-containing protein n=1 Tax=Sphingomonas kyungheensis TaxID=1069987 RepID=A0ABU8H455_9SPHN
MNMHTIVMTRLLSKVLVLAGAVGTIWCWNNGHDPKPPASDWQKAGWHYRFDDDKEIGAAMYRFQDNSQQYFMALCDIKPLFHLVYGKVPIESTTFQLQVDQSRFSFRRYDGAGLMVIDPAVADAFARSKKNITFSVGPSYLVRIPPSPLIAKLIKACRSRNKPDRR